MIHPNQTATVNYQAEHGGRAPDYTDDLNLTGLAAGAAPDVPRTAGRRRTAASATFFLADHGPFDTDELRFYVAGFFGYDFLFDKDGGGGVKLRDKGGDFNLTKGGALGVNFDRHWGAEVEMLETPLNVRPASRRTALRGAQRLAILPTLRYRWPFLDGRLVPFVTAGLGGRYLIGNDPRPAGGVPEGRGQVVVFLAQVDSPRWWARSAPASSTS